MSASGSNRPAAAARRLRCLSRCAALLLFACAGTPLAAADLELHRVEDLEYGRALFHYFQGDQLGAITQLMIAAERPQVRLRTQTDEANLLLADLYYRYGLYEESRQLFAELLSAEVSDSVQNRIWFNLARLRFEQGYYEQSRDLLARINDRLPDQIESERKYLLTNLYLGEKRYEEAADISNQISSASIWKIYARYNLAVTRLEDDSYEVGKSILERIGKMGGATPEMLALRDRANLSLGLKQLRLEMNESALESLSRVRLEGPLSHHALLATGWARYRMNQFDKALLPWRLLLNRNAVDAATQEAILAIPSSYAELGQDRLAISHYEIAARQFDAQIRLLIEAVAAVEAGSLIDALRDRTILSDRGSLERLPPSSPVTPQLHLLMASTGFQREVRRYQDLLDIRTSLSYWGTSFPALELMLDERRRAFDRRLPKLEQSTSFERLKEFRRQRDEYARLFNDIEARQDYAAFATPEEEEHLERIERTRETMRRVSSKRNTAYQQDMLRVLSGLLRYQLATEYPVRRWQTKKRLIHLDRALAEAEYRVDSLRRIAERTELNFEFFRQRIDGRSERILGLRARVDELLKKQAQHINDLAIAALREQQKHVVQLRLNARFELARLYDKLAAGQSGAVQ